MRTPGLESKALGILYGVLTAVMVAFYITINKYIYAHYDISAVEYSLIFLLAGAVFALISLSRKLDRRNRQLFKNNFSALVLLGISGTASMFLLVIGQQYTTAINTALLMTTTIISTIFFSWLMLREKPTSNQYVWMAVLFAGVYLGVVGLHKLHLHAGDLIILSAVVIFGFGNAYSRKLMTRMNDSSLSPDVRLAVGAVLGLVPFIALTKDYELLGHILPLTLISGFFYWACIKAFAKSVHLINANNAIVLNNAQIFFTSIAGVMILSEAYSLEKLVGSIAVIISIYFITHKRNLN